jgi:hypothetical protein
VEAEWGGATWELESIDAAEGHSRMRRNDPGTGEAIWVHDVPFDVTGFLQDRDLLYLFGPDGLATLEWHSGKPIGLVRGIPQIRTLFQCNGSFLAWAFDGRVLSFN